MFESKIPVAKKSKLSVKSDTSDLGSQAKLDNQVISQEVLSEDDHNSDATMDLERNTNLSKNRDEIVHTNGAMNSKNVEKKNSSTKLRLTKNKINLEDLELACSLGKTDTGLRLQEGIISNRTNDVSNQNMLEHSQSSPPMPNNWNLKKLKYSDLNISPQSLNLGKYHQSKSD